MDICELRHLIVEQDPTGEIYADNPQTILDLVPHNMRVPYNQQEGRQPVAAEYDEDDNITALLYWDNRIYPEIGSSWDIEENPDSEQLAICNVKSDRY